MAGTPIDEALITIQVSLWARREGTLNPDELPMLTYLESVYLAAPASDRIKTLIETLRATSAVTCGDIYAWEKTASMLELFVPGWRADIPSN